MSVDDVNWGLEEITLKEKKLSREEKKNEMAMRLFNKMEGLPRPIQNVTPKQEPKPKIQQAPAPLPSKPRKKVKVATSEPQGDASEKQSPQQNNEFQSSSASQHQNGKERPKHLSVINSLYILNDNEDIYSHLVDYEMTERSRFVDALNQQQLDASALPNSSGSLQMFSRDAMDRTGKAFSKIQNKFQELRCKLVRPNSKEHREFGSQFLTTDYLLH